MENKLLWVINQKNDFEWSAQGSKWKRNDSGSYIRKLTIGHELGVLNGKEMTLGHK